MWGNLRDKSDTYCNSPIIYAWKMQMTLKEYWKCNVYKGYDVKCIRNKQRESFICDIYLLVPRHEAVSQEQVNIDYFASSFSHKSA